MGIHVVGIGGSTRPGSLTETIVGRVLQATAELGCSTELISGPELILPPYGVETGDDLAAKRLIDAYRRADAIVIGSPGYHGSVSGLIKNALDYTEALRNDERVYFDGLPVGCITTAFGWQGAVNTLASLRQIVHALRGWPTPLGLAVNSADGSLFQAGEIAETNLRNSIDTLAGQLFTFTHTHSAAPAV